MTELAVQRPLIGGVYLDDPAQNSRDEWYTPKKYVDAARRVFGGRIDLDVASCSFANRTVKAERFYSQVDNAMVQDWSAKSLWCNPPYSKVKSFVDRLIADYERGIVDAAILLVSPSFDAGWFAPLWDYPVCLSNHRPKFYRAQIVRKNRPGKGRAFVYMGSDLDAFKREFEPFGAIVRRV